MFVTVRISNTPASLQLDTCPVIMLLSERTWRGLSETKYILGPVKRIRRTEDLNSTVSASHPAKFYKSKKEKDVTEPPKMQHDRRNLKINDFTECIEYILYYTYTVSISDRYLSVNFVCKSVNCVNRSNVIHLAENHSLCFNVLGGFSTKIQQVASGNEVSKPNMIYNHVNRTVGTRILKQRIQEQSNN
ncbi:hypothetical protein CLF_110821 [Clonorchis sinensis]|uniref:Uncharacterized protein n=1 Tax=Clonorchis sinensis TaxID=79923 RepID=G7YTX7_CLOSI|nr:hypothetical protein CLF_110821 [Clonorchis sinensis]